MEMASNVANAGGTTVRKRTSIIHPRKTTFHMEEDVEQDQILSVDNLSEWIYRFCNLAKSLIKKHNTFVDSFGVLRNSDWSPVDPSDIIHSPLISTDETRVKSGTFSSQNNGDNIPQLPPPPPPPMIASESQFSFGHIQQLLDWTGCLSLPIACYRSSLDDHQHHHQQPRKQSVGSRQRARTKSRKMSWHSNIESLKQSTLQQDTLYHDDLVYQTTWFLSDWQRLWMYLKDDQDDEMALYAPFFRMCVEVFFHRRTCQLMYVLFLYNFLVYFILQVSYPQALPPLLMNTNYCNLIVQLSVYLCARFVYKGAIPRLLEQQFLYEDNPQVLRDDSLYMAEEEEEDTRYGQQQQHHQQQQQQQQGEPCDDRPTTATSASKAHQRRTNNNNNNYNNNLPSSSPFSPSSYEEKMVSTKLYSVHWTSTIKQLLRKSFQEARQLLTDYYTHIKTTRHFTKRQMSFYAWCNISLKFLTRHNGLNAQKAEFNRQGYRMMLMFVVFLLPVYIFVVNFVEIYLIYIYPQCKYQSGQQTCQFFLSLAYATGGCLTLFLLQYIYAASMLVSLVGLAYGGEIAYRLADCWLKKYGCLRRVSCLDSCYIERKYISDHPSNTAAAAAAASAPSRFAAPSTSSSPVVSFLTKKKSTDEQKEATPSTAAPESLPSHAASGEHVHVLEGFKSGGIEDDANNMNEEEMKKEEMLVKSSKEISDLICRDATEHYLFIRESINRAGKIWSPILTGLFFVLIYISIVEVLYLTEVQLKYIDHNLNLVRAAVFVSVRILFFFVYPIISIAFANLNLMKFGDVFKVAASEDYEVLGGRDRWLDLFTNFPVIWTYYGITITFDRLIGVLWTASLALASYVLTQLTLKGI